MTVRIYKRNNPEYLKIMSQIQKMEHQAYILEVQKKYKGANYLYREVDRLLEQVS